MDDHSLDSDPSTPANRDLDRRVIDSVNAVQVCPGAKRDRCSGRAGPDGDEHPLVQRVRGAVDNQRSPANFAQGTDSFIPPDCSWSQVRFGGLASRKDGVVRGCDVTSAVHRDERGHAARLRRLRFCSAKWCQKMRSQELFGTTSQPDASGGRAQIGWEAVMRAFISRTACCQPTKIAWATIAWPMFSSLTSGNAATRWTLW